MTFRSSAGALLLMLCLTGSALAAGFTDPTTGMEFVLVKGDCFEMGDTRGDGLANEQPVHEACVSDFYIGKYEVTQAQYLKMIRRDAAGYKGLCPDCPVVNVTFDDAKNFLGTLAQESQLSYRLPYEDEWEFAARNRGAGQRWPGTNEQSGLGEYAWFAGNSQGEYHPVGQKRPNKLGVHDLGGNVAEWCEDFYAETYDAAQPLTETGMRRVVRGGSWRDAEPQLRATARTYLKPIVRPVHKATNGKYDVDLGFRVVLPAEKLKHKELYLALADKDGTKVAAALRKLRGKELAPRAQGELLLAAIALLPEFDMSKEIEALIKSGADVNLRNQDGVTPLIMLFDRLPGRIYGSDAAKQHARADALAVKLTSLLVEGGANVNARDLSGRTALAQAARAGARKTVALLIEKSADVNAKTQEQQTPLMLACKSQYEYVSNSAEKNNGWEEDVLVPAIRQSYEAVAGMLKGAGADFAAKDASGKTALEYAQDRDNERLVALFAKKQRYN